MKKIAEAKADENDALAENLEVVKTAFKAECKRLANKGIESSISTIQMDYQVEWVV